MKMTEESTAAAMRNAGKDPTNPDEFDKFVDYNASKFPGTDSADLANEVKRLHRQQVPKQQPDALKSGWMAAHPGATDADYEAYKKGKAPPPPTSKSSAKAGAVSGDDLDSIIKALIAAQPQGR